MKRLLSTAICLVCLLMFASVVTAAPGDVTVTFLNWDSSNLSTQTIPYGTDAVAPSVPPRTGYVFTGWSGSYTNVTEDRTLIAQFAAVTPTPTPSPTPTPTSTPTPTPTPTRKPTPTPTHKPTATPTPVPTATPTPEPTATPVPEATATPVPTATTEPAATTISETTAASTDPAATTGPGDSQQTQPGKRSFTGILIGMGIFLVIGGLASGFIEEYRFRHLRAKLREEGK